MPGKRLAPEQIIGVLRTGESGRSRRPRLDRPYRMRWARTRGGPPRRARRCLITAPSGVPPPPRGSGGGTRVATPHRHRPPPPRPRRRRGGPRGVGVGVGIAAAVRRPRARAQGAAPTAPAPGFSRFEVGGLTAATLHDGHLRHPAVDRSLVRNAEPAALQAALRESFVPTTHSDIPIAVTSVETPRGLGAFDGGTGGQVTPTAAGLEATMRAAGLAPARVALVGRPCLSLKLRP
jgi:hypothetical protein